MVKGVEKGYILKIENFVKINVHIPLNEATNKTLTDVKKRSITFQCCLKFQKIPNSPGAMAARSSAPPSPKLHSKIEFFLLNILTLICLITLKVEEID